MGDSLRGPEKDFWFEDAVRIFFRAEPATESEKYGKILDVLSWFKTGHSDSYCEQIIEICKTMEGSRSIAHTVAAVTACNPTKMEIWLNLVMDDLILDPDVQSHHVLGGVLGLFEAGAHLPRPERRPYLYEPMYGGWMEENIQRIADTSAGACYKLFPYMHSDDFRKGVQDQEYRTFKSDLGGAVSRCLACVDGGRRDMIYAIVTKYVKNDDRRRRWVCPVAFLVMRQLCISHFASLIVGEPERVLALYARSLVPKAKAER